MHIRETQCFQGFAGLLCLFWVFGGAVVVLPVVIGGAVRGAVSTVSGVKIRQWGVAEKVAGPAGRGVGISSRIPCASFPDPGSGKMAAALQKFFRFFEKCQN